MEKEVRIDWSSTLLWLTTIMAKSLFYLPAVCTRHFLQNLSVVNFNLQRGQLESRLQESRDQLNELKTNSNDRINTLGSLVSKVKVYLLSPPLASTLWERISAQPFLHTAASALFVQLSRTHDTKIPVLSSIWYVVVNSLSPIFSKGVSLNGQWTFMLTHGKKKTFRLRHTGFVTCRCRMMLFKNWWRVFNNY